MSNDLTPIQKSSALDFTGMLEVAKELVPTGFLPEHIKTPGQCVAIILAGRELGMEPMLALRSITMVKGKIIVNADAQLALFKARGGRAVFRTLTADAAILDLIHPNGDTHSESFSMLDAKRANLIRRSSKNPNEPSMWEKYPKAMLRSRVITSALKSIGFEPTAGAYDPEEAQSFTAEPLPAITEGSGSENPTMGSVAGSAANGTATAPETPSTTPDNGSDSPTRDTPFPLGQHKGKLLREFPEKDLKWGIVEGRNLGPDTEAWQQLMRAELEDRLLGSPSLEHDELMEKVGSANEERAEAVGL